MEFKDFQIKYPHLFKEYPRSGFDLRPGWETLINILCSIIENHIAYSLPEEVRADVYCVQLKEKFGGCRLYLNHETPFMTGAIAMMEYMSLHLCETCGMPGQRRTGGWILTLCDEHHAKRESQRPKS